MPKNNHTGFLAKLAITGLATAGAALLARTLIKRNYGDYINLKSLCQEIIQRLEEESKNQETTIAPCLILDTLNLKE
jgi:hypothetical protein